MRKLGAGNLHKAVARQATLDNIAIDRGRRWVAVAAFIQLLEVAVEEGKIGKYYIKGGFSVELRHRNTARTSDDIDLVVAGASSARDLLLAVLEDGWADFQFIIKKSEKREHAERIIIQARFNNNDWCTFKVDLLEDPTGQIERVAPFDIERFGLPPTQPVACLSRAEQLAQYIHSITKPAIDGRRPDRARNLIDVYLFDTFSPCDDAAVVEAATEVFAREPTHAWPPVVDIPSPWLATLDEWIAELGWKLTSAEIVEYFQRYLTRLLGVPVTMNYEYRFYVLVYKSQRSADPGDASAERLFTSDQGLTGFQQAIGEGFRLLQFMPWERVGGVVAILERPVRAA